MDDISLPLKSEHEVVRPPDVVSSVLGDDDDEEEDDDGDETAVEDNATGSVIGNGSSVIGGSRSRPIVGKVLSRGFTPKSSCFFTESQPSVATVMGSINM